MSLAVLATFSYITSRRTDHHHRQGEKDEEDEGEEGEEGKEGDGEEAISIEELLATVAEDETNDDIIKRGGYAEPAEPHRTYPSSP